MIICKNCKTENADDNITCSGCGKDLLIAILECINGDENISAGTIWKLYGKDYKVGRSEHNDIQIKGTCISRHHFNLNYDSEQNIFYYESLARNTFDFEKKTYKILDGAIIPLPEAIELKLNYQ